MKNALNYFFLKFKYVVFIVVSRLEECCIVTHQPLIASAVLAGIAILLLSAGCVIIGIRVTQK